MVFLDALVMKLRTTSLFYKEMLLDGFLDCKCCLDIVVAMVCYLVLITNCSLSFLKNMLHGSAMFCILSIILL